MKGMLFLLASLATSLAYAKPPCVEWIPEKVWEERKRDLDAATTRALKAKGWQRLKVGVLPRGRLPPGELQRTARLADGGTNVVRLPLKQHLDELNAVPGDVLEPGASDAGEARQRTMFLAMVEEFVPERFVFARDSQGNVFQVHLDLTEKPRRIIRSCHCRNTGHARSRRWLVAEVNEGDRLVYRQDDLVVVPLKLRTVQVRYRADEACGTIP